MNNNYWENTSFSKRPLGFIFSTPFNPSPICSATGDSQWEAQSIVFWSHEMPCDSVLPNPPTSLASSSLKPTHLHRGLDELCFWNLLLMMGIRRKNGDEECTGEEEYEGSGMRWWTRCGCCSQESLIRSCVHLGKRGKTLACFVPKQLCALTVTHSWLPQGCLGGSLAIK